MRTLVELEAAIEQISAENGAPQQAAELLRITEEVIEHWIVARGDTPTAETREGFRLLALHRQGAKGDPSFNACRETCREVAYHCNLISMQPEHTETTNRLEMMKMISSHVYLFISGKMQVAELGEFCCSSKPVRLAPETNDQMKKEA
jgi:hypothetical protein